MNLSRLLSIIFTITLLTSSCRDEFTLCTQSKDVKFNANFYEKNSNIDVPKSAPSLTIYPLGNPLPIVNGLANTQAFSLALDNIIDTSKFVISISNGLPKDTIKIIYSSQSVLLSVDCGNIINYNLAKITTTKHTIDTIKISSPIVSNRLLRNAKFYF